MNDQENQDLQFLALEGVELAPDVLQTPQEPDSAAPQSEPTPEQTPPQESDAELRARANGWVPQEEFRGNPEQWKSAEDFNAAADNNPGMLRERNEALASKIDALEKQFQTQNQGYQDTIDRIQHASRVALENQRRQIYQDFENAKYQAVEDGDTERYQQLNRDQGEAIQQFDKQVQPEREQQAQPQAGQQQLSPQDKQAVDSWMNENRWMSDPELQGVAEAHHMRLNREKPGLSLQENLREVTNYVRQRYPDKFGIRPKPQTNHVEGNARSTSGPSANVASLPAEAMAIARELVDQGAFKSVEDYAKVYFSQG
jgi:hypothetical protein